MLESLISNNSNLDNINKNTWFKSNRTDNIPKVNRKRNLTTSIDHIFHNNINNHSVSFERIWKKRKFSRKITGFNSGNLCSRVRNNFKRRHSINNFTNMTRTEVQRPNIDATNCFVDIFTGDNTIENFCRRNESHYNSRFSAPVRPSTQTRSRSDNSLSNNNASNQRRYNNHHQWSSSNLPQASSSTSSSSSPSHLHSQAPSLSISNNTALPLRNQNNQNSVRHTIPSNHNQISNNQSDHSQQPHSANNSTHQSNTNNTLRPFVLSQNTNTNNINNHPSSCRNCTTAILNHYAHQQQQAAPTQYITQLIPPQPHALITLATVSSSTSPSTLTSSTTTPAATSQINNWHHTPSTQQPHNYQNTINHPTNSYPWPAYVDVFQPTNTVSNPSNNSAFNTNRHIFNNDPYRNLSRLIPPPHQTNIGGLQLVMIGRHHHRPNISAPSSSSSLNTASPSSQQLVNFVTSSLSLATAAMLAAASLASTTILNNNNNNNVATTTTTTNNNSNTNQNTTNNAQAYPTITTTRLHNPPTYLPHQPQPHLYPQPHIYPAANTTALFSSPASHFHPTIQDIRPQPLFPPPYHIFDHLHLLEQHQQIYQQQHHHQPHQNQQHSQTQNLHNFNATLTQGVTVQNLPKPTNTGITKYELDNIPLKQFISSIVIDENNGDAGDGDNVKKAVDDHDDDADDSDDEDDDREKCMICLENFINNDWIRMLRCTHDFHSQCVDKWLKINRTCPLCRSDVCPIQVNNSNKN